MDFKEDIIKRFVSSANTDQHSDVEIQGRELPDDGQDPALLSFSSNFRYTGHTLGLPRSVIS